MARLWKGIFYCFWMSDKPRVQQALAQELADIVQRVSSVQGALAYLAGFWEAVTREWTGIDRLR
jgi:ribosomal RNA-processing protein 1